MISAYGSTAAERINPEIVIIKRTFQTELYLASKIFSIRAKMKHYKFL